MEYDGEIYKVVPNNIMNSESIKNIKKVLATLGYLNRASVNTYYDIECENAIRNFQADYSLEVTGVVDEDTWNMLFLDFSNDDNFQDNIPLETEITEYGVNNNDSFFGRKRKYMNNSTIIISVGEEIVKTIEGVVFRSKAQIIQSDGTPVKEIYSFIARDINESEE